MSVLSPLLPAPPLRGEACVAALAALAVVTAAAVGLRSALALDPWFPARAAGVIALGTIVALPGLARHHPWPRLGAANLVTLGRTAITAVLLALVPEPAAAGPAAVAVGLAAIAIVLDGVDGWLARRDGTASAFGARFDMEIDALLMLVLAGLVWRHGQAPAWVLGAGLLRYAFVAAGRPWPWLRRALSPSRRRQAACVVPLVGLTAALAPFIAPPASTVLAAVATGVVAWSFAVDVAWLARRRAGTVPETQ
jgi:phosphatidylglycerophosphate synthase